jgi:hypothetical protein
MCLGLFLPEHFFYLSHCKTCRIMSVDNACLQTCLLVTSNFIITLTFSSFDVNRSGPGTSSTTNHKFYRALGRLHGPWCNTTPYSHVIFESHVLAIYRGPKFEIHNTHHPFLPCSGHFCFWAELAHVAQPSYTRLGDTTFP